MKDIAKMTQMATTASTEVVRLGRGQRKTPVQISEDCYDLCHAPFDTSTHHSHSDLRELFFGEVQRMVDHSDSIFSQVGTFRQVCTKNGIISHIHERHHGMPALIVVPHLWKCCTVTLN